MAAFSRVTVIGTGLIGASLGLALKRIAQPPHVTGFDQAADSVRSALRIGALDESSATLAGAVRAADLIVLAVPVRAERQVMQEAAEALPEGAVVTDTGSTKVQIMQWARELLPARVSFVGGHPMAGKTESGPSAADADLFRGAVYCLVPSPRARQEAVGAVAQFVDELGAIPYFLDADEHDGLVGAVSHVPYLLAVALMLAVSEQPGWSDASKLASTGFASAVRLAASEPGMFADILSTNQEQVLRHLTAVMEQLRAIQAGMESGDATLLDLLEGARKAHQAWLAQRSASSRPH